MNDRIRVPEVRLVGPAGEQVGIVSINDALRLAQESDLDLVEVAPTARPPVCKLMDYGKFKYESALKARESRKNQAQTVIKEIKIRPKIDPHDYSTKKGHVERFLKQGDKVKVTIMFRGREQSRPELGYKLLQQLAGDVEELGFVESQPKQDGRNMIMVIGPHRKNVEARSASRPTERVRSRPSGPAPTEQAVEQAVELAVEQAVEQAEEAAPARPAARPVPASAPAATATRPAAPRPDSAPAERTAQQRSPVSTEAGTDDSAESSASKPAAPRPAAPRPSAPKPGAPRPATPRPAAAPKPAPPRSGAPRPAAPKPAPPRSGAPRPVPTPRPRSSDQSGAGADSGG
ncbi:MAG: translation initiation factor IF-3 [Streptosporangiaceae bacterium]